MRILVTGGAGFIGGHFVELLLKEKPDWEIHVLDMSGVGSREGTIEGVEWFHKGRIESTFSSFVMSGREFDYVVNFAAETHVDRSFVNPSDFVASNTLGVSQLLSACRRQQSLKMFLQVSTDEVYGPTAVHAIQSHESDLLSPRNPYSISKAAGEQIALCLGKLWNIPVCVTRGSNTFGPRQNREKLIPKIICNALEGKEIPIYGKGEQIRTWLSVYDHCRGILQVLLNSMPDEVWNLSGHFVLGNLKLCELIMDVMEGLKLGDFRKLITFVEDRAIHDNHYSMSKTKTRDGLPWYPIDEMDDVLIDTIQSCRKDLGL